MACTWRSPSGASLWHMNQMIGRAIGHFDLDGEALNMLISIGPPGYVITDRFGQRFADEHGQAMLRHDFYYDLLLYDPARNLRPRVPCFWFFDETRRQAGPLTLTHIGATAVGRYDWSPDNTAEIERGWIAQADTIEEAARVAGVDDPAAAAATVAEYNRLCESGEADPQGRPRRVDGAHHGAAVPLRGPVARRLEHDGRPSEEPPRSGARPLRRAITGLYVAGELGQASGLLYPGDGSNLGEALCFGQITVEHALST